MWDRFWYFLIFAFIAYLMILFSIIVDLYWRDRRTPGLIKAIWVIFLIILSYVTALVYLTFEGRAWPFERAKPPVPPGRRDRRIYPRGGRLLARAGNRRRQNVARRRHNHPTGIRLAQSQSAQPDLTAAAPGRVLAMAEQRSEADITDGAAQVRDPSYQTGTRTPRPRPSNSVPPPLNRVLCRAISRNHALRSALSGEPRGRAAVS